ncbi:MAG: hypothetical protein PHR77_07240 [Kiritimatiellae bacterium]|nr:hypothetical protein [Kiritimatiellia bacterium]MDD5519275.1 hypothetical protein [Kiritimatiellia bacterium]
MNNVEKLKTIILNNWKLKLLASGLAILVIYEIREATSFEVPYDIPIKVEVGEGIAILDQPKTVRVVFKGSQEDLRRLSQNEIAAIIRPKATDPAGSEKITIKQSDVQGVSGVRVMQIEPRVIKIVFDREIEKDVAVAKPSIIGTPLIGKVELDYQPRVVKIRGSNLRLRNKEEVSTEPIDVDGRVESFSKTVRILPSRDTWVSKIQPAEVTVDVNIVTESVTKEWNHVVVRGIVDPGTAEDMHFEPNYVKVTLKGRMEEIENVISNSMMAFVDCTMLSSGMVIDLPVKIHLPPNVDVETIIEPAAVKAFGNR